MLRHAATGLEVSTDISKTEQVDGEQSSYLHGTDDSGDLTNMRDMDEQSTTDGNAKLNAYEGFLPASKRMKLQ